MCIKPRCDVHSPPLHTRRSEPRVRMPSSNQPMNESIRSFSFAMILGGVYGTCSSLFFAAPMAYLVMNKKDKKAASK